MVMVVVVVTAGCGGDDNGGCGDCNGGCGDGGCGNGCDVASQNITQYDYINLYLFIQQPFELIYYSFNYNQS